MSSAPLAQVTLHPIATVRGGRSTHDDDHWGGVISTIELDTNRFGPDAIAGIDEFSHLIVVYLFHLVEPGSEITGERHPRNRDDLPLVGIFAQRAKRRPNRIGVSMCRIVGVEQTNILVEGLDAMNGTPVFDLKPHMVEFNPRGKVCQPNWSHQIMAEYFDTQWR